MNRADYLGAPAKFNLAAACTFINQAFPHGGVYLVGSCLEKRDYRDVDVRAIITDDEFYRLFPTLKPQTTIDGAGNTSTSRPTAQLDPTWSLFCVAISGWLEKHTGLPIDFQIQSMSEVNEKYPKEKRNALGLYYAPKD